MVRRLGLVGFSALVAALISGCSAASEEAASSEAPLTSDAISMTRNPDGTFHVVCDNYDGTTYVETLSASEVNAGHVCNRTATSTPFQVEQSGGRLALYANDRLIVTWQNPKSFSLQRDYALLIDNTDFAAAFKADGTRIATWNHLTAFEARPSYFVLRDNQDFSAIFGLDGRRLATWNSTTSWVAKDGYVVLTDRDNLSRVFRADGTAIADWRGTTQVRSAEKYVLLTDNTAFSRAIAIASGATLAEWRSTRDAAVGEAGFALLDTDSFMRVVRLDGTVAREVRGVTAIRMTGSTLRYTVSGVENVFTF